MRTRKGDSSVRRHMLPSLWGWGSVDQGGSSGMRSRVLAVRTTGALVLSSALALTSSACTAGDNGPLDPNASAALPVVSAPSHLTAASASATAPASAAPSKPATTTKPIRTFASRSCHGTVFAQVPGDEQYGFTACGSA